MRVHFADVAGVRTRWYEAGPERGDPLVLLHGVGLPAEVWIGVMPLLARRHRVLVPDMLGCGMTEAGPRHAGAPHGPVLAHLRAWLDHIGVGRFSVGGGALGAVLATHLYLAQPQRVKALAIVSSGSAFRDDAGLRAMYEKVRANGLSVLDDPTWENCAMRLRRIFGPNAQIPEALITTQMICCALPGARDEFIRRVDAMCNVDAWRPWRLDDRLREVNIPVLAIFGGRDPQADAALALERLADLPRPARFLVFPECGHYPQLEEAERFAAAMGDFLAEAHGMSPPALASAQHAGAAA